MGWVWGKNDMEWVEGARCEDAPSCGCCDIKELRGDYDDEPPDCRGGHCPPFCGCEDYGQHNEKVVS